MFYGIMLSGGTGSRAGGDIPKQYVEIKGFPIIKYSMEAMAGMREIAGFQVVAGAAWRGYLQKVFEDCGWGDKILGYSEPGKNRQLSILNSLEDMEKYAASDDIIIVHDAARPRITVEMLRQYMHALEGYDGVMPVLSMKDTVYRSTDGKRVDGLLSRSEIVAGQAPELFVFGKYLKANRNLLPERILDINGSTEPALLHGMNIAMTPGCEENYKITTPEDMRRFERQMSECL